MKCAVIGLGYVGLQEAVYLAQRGAKVYGVDTNLSLVNDLKNGQSHVLDVSNETLKNVQKLNRLHISTSYAVIEDCDVVTICVPTPLNESNKPDLSYVEACAHQLIPFLSDKRLVILESTSYPGTTKDFFCSILETAGLLLGKDFLLAFSPERIDPGNKLFNFINTPKVVGGVDEESRKAAVDFFEKYIDGNVISVSNAETAELVKLLENTYRYINIAFINEFSTLCKKLEVDTLEVINAASTKPYGFAPFYPNLGVGGHCIAVDPLYLEWCGDMKNAPLKIIKTCSESLQKVFESQLEIILDSLSFVRERSPRVLIIGVTYKDGVADTRESPSVRLMQSFKNNNVSVRYYDDLIDEFSVDGTVYRSIRNIKDSINEWADCIVVCNRLANENEFRNLLERYDGKIFDFKGIYKNKIKSNNYYSL